jgi:hypothetical protein
MVVPFLRAISIGSWTTLMMDLISTHSIFGLSRLATILPPRLFTALSHLPRVLNNLSVTDLQGLYIPFHAHRCLACLNLEKKAGIYAL